MLLGAFAGLGKQEPLAPGCSSNLHLAPVIYAQKVRELLIQLGEVQLRGKQKSGCD